MALKRKSTKPAATASNGSFEEQLAFLRLYHKGDNASLARDVLGGFKSSTYTALEPHFEIFEDAVKVPAPCLSFRDGVTTAFGEFRIATLVKPADFARDRAAMKSLSRAAVSAARESRNFEEQLTRLPREYDLVPATARAILALYPDIVEAVAPPYVKLAARLAVMARGGRPPMDVYEVLVLGLARAFEAATGCKASVTWSAHRDCFSGQFFALVEAALPIAVTRGKFAYPATPKARGEFIKRVLRGRTGGAGRRRGKT